MTKLSLTSLYWLVLQVVAIVLCCQRKALSESAQGCVGSQLRLSCPEMNVIEIKAVVLHVGISSCKVSKCCIKDDCIRNASANHTKNVQSKCDNKRSCTVKVLKETISPPCGKRTKSDFERIMYDCIDSLQRLTTATFAGSDSTDKSFHSEKNTPAKEQEHASGTLPIVMATVCLLVLTAIVVVVVRIRKKSWTTVSSIFTMTDNDSSDENEAIYQNENQTMSLSNGDRSPIYTNGDTEESRHTIARASETYEVPRNSAYSLTDDSGSRRSESTDIYRDVYIMSRELACQVKRPRSQECSWLREDVEIEFAGSAAGLSDECSYVYCDVETREPEIVASTQNACDDACNWKKTEYKDATAKKTIPPAMEMKKTTAPVPITPSDLCTKVNKPSKNAATFDAINKVEAKSKVDSGVGFPNPGYETMSHIIYANVPAMLSGSSVGSGALLTGGSETENLYCDMTIKYKGSKTVV